MIRRLLLLGLLGLLGSQDLFAEPANFSRRHTQKIAVEKPMRTLTVGEHLVFDVFWMGIQVGLGELEVREKTRLAGRQAFHVVAVAKTNDFLSKIYPVHDEVHSFIECETLYSLQFRKTLSEGRYRADEITVFDAERRKGFYESFLNKSKREFEIPGPVHDIVSAFYWFRLQEVPAGGKVSTMVSNKEKDWVVEIRVLGLQQKELRGNRVVPTILVEPKTSLKEVLYRRGRVWVYLSTDKTRTPVWVTFKTPFGPVVGVLRNSP